MVAIRNTTAQVPEVMKAVASEPGTRRRCPRAMTDLGDAWAAVHAARWYVGQPMEHPERGEWAMFAYDTTELSVVRSMAD